MARTAHPETNPFHPSETAAAIALAVMDARCGLRTWTDCDDEPWACEDSIEESNGIEYSVCLTHRTEQRLRRRYFC